MLTGEIPHSFQERIDVWKDGLPFTPVYRVAAHGSAGSKRLAGLPRSTATTWRREA
jgi:hypothetical protein